MEEKILEALNKINERLDKTDEGFDQIKKEMLGFNEKLCDFDKMREKILSLDEIKEKLRDFDEMKEKLVGIEGRIAQEIRQQILDHMFVFETEYGRKINIAYEEITARNQKENIQNEMIQNLERRTDMNSAFVHSHEERITVLEKAKI